MLIARLSGSSRILASMGDAYMRLYSPSVQFELVANYSGTTTGCNQPSLKWSSTTSHLFVGTSAEGKATPTEGHGIKFLVPKIRDRINFIAFHSELSRNLALGTEMQR